MPMVRRNRSCGCRFPKYQPRFLLNVKLLEAIPHHSLSRPKGGSFTFPRFGKYHGARPLGAAGLPPRMALFPCPTRARGCCHRGGEAAGDD